MNGQSQRVISGERSEVASRDLLGGLQSYRLWGALGWLDIKQRYRRSTIGPFWITLSLGLKIIGMGAVYSSLFGMQVADYLPYLASGLIVWTTISTLIIEGCTVFIQAEGAIKQMPVPLSVHVFRMVYRNLIVLAH